MGNALLSAITLRPLAHETGDVLVALVGCGKSKSSTPAPARELYTSPLFRKSLELAELVAGRGRVFVASAALGVVALDDVVAPYDTTLHGFSVEERATWARIVLDALEERALRSHGRIRPVLFMGATYADPIIARVRELAESSTAWAPAVDVLRGLEIGERLVFLNRAIPIARGAS